MTESARYLSVAVKAARVGGGILLKNLGKLRQADVRMKGKADWVTTVDHASEAVILKILKKAFPGHTLQAEETAPVVKGADLQWFIDPLDGTVNYIHGFPMFGVSIGLRRKGVLEVGVVYDPLREELFTAQRGKGAWLNGRRIHVAAGRTMKGSLLATGFPFRASKHLDLYLRSFRRIFLETGAIRRAGSAALDLAYTACGRVGGFWEMALSPWDMAAGALLIQEAGGVVSDFFGESSYLSNGHIAAGNPEIHRQMVKLLTPIFRGKLAG